MTNPQYTGTFTFDNDYPSLLPDMPRIEVDDSGLFVASAERGICRVVCFSPRHDLRIARMDSAELRQVI